LFFREEQGRTVIAPEPFALLGEWGEAKIGGCMKNLRSKWMLHTICLGLIACLVNPAMTTAQTAGRAARNDWETLKAVAVDEELIVVRKDGRETKGRFRECSDAALTVTRRKKPQAFARADIQRVYRLERRSARKATLIGTAIGAGIGAGIGGKIIAGPGESGETYPFPILTGLGAGFGALTGYLIGHAKRRVLVYDGK
jgi:hypothetical protein